MDPLKQLCERLTAATAEIDEMLGTEEKPRKEPLSDEDRAKLGELDKECEKLNADIDKAKAAQAAEQELRKRQAARKKALSSQSQGRRTTPGDPGGSDSDQAASQTPPDKLAELRRIIPSRYTPLQNFKGPDAEYNAYATGCWLLAQVGKHPRLASPVTDKAEEWCREHLAMGGTAHSKGGALVPDELLRTIIDLKQQYGVLRREADVEPMASDTKTVPIQASGLTAYAVGENEEVTASDAGWTDLDLVAKKWGVLSKHSSELDEDAIISMADKLAGEAAWALAKKEDECGFLGNGTSTYHGIDGLITKVFATAAAKKTAATGNTAFGTLDLVDFTAMIGMLPDYADQAKWYISRVGWANSMMRLVETAGGQTGEMIAGKVRPLFMGFPVVWVQVMNRTTTAQTSTDGLCYLGDFKKGVTLGNRRDVRMIVSADRYLEYDQIGILFTERYDVVVHNIGGRSDDASDNGPIIGLATPAS